MNMLGKFAFALIVSFFVQICLAALAPAYPFITEFILAPAGFVVIFMAAFCELNFATM